MVEKGIWNKDSNRANTREQERGGRRVSGTELSLLQVIPRGSTSQTGGPAGKEGQSRGAEQGGGVGTRR